MIWENYVFRRGAEVEDLWDQMFEERKEKGQSARILYVAGRGFDTRANAVLEKFTDRLGASKCEVSEAKLLLLEFSGYQLSEDLHAITEENTKRLTQIFAQFGEVETLTINGSVGGDDDISATSELRLGAEKVLNRIDSQTDVIIDVSSLPRIVYLSIILYALAKLLPNGAKDGGLYGGGITLHILVAEDASLDSKISAEDPSNDLVLIPGFSAALHTESMQDIPLVWFPILGENRISQIQKIEEVIPSVAEICPVLPHPSRDPRRGDKLLMEYEKELFVKREIPLSNIIYVHEGHPFEVYRQLLRAMKRYRETLEVIGGCRIVVTPLASKLITVGAALACFDMKQLASQDLDALSTVAIPYAEPTRYIAKISDLKSSEAEISALILTGDSYQC